MTQGPNFFPSKQKKKKKVNDGEFLVNFFIYYKPGFPTFFPWKAKTELAGKGLNATLCSVQVQIQLSLCVVEEGLYLKLTGRIDRVSREVSVRTLVC